MFGASLHVGRGASARTVCNADTVAEVKPAAQAAGQPDAQPSLQPDGHPQLRPTGPRPGASPEAPARLGPPPLVRAFKILSIIAGNFLTVAVQNFIIFEYHLSECTSCETSASLYDPVYYSEDFR